VFLLSGPKNHPRIRQESPNCPVARSLAGTPWVTPLAWESRGKSARPELSTSRKTPHVEAFRETKSDQLGAVFRFAAAWPSTAIRCTKSDVGRRWNWDRDTYVLIGDAGPSLHGQPRWSRHRTHSRLGPLPCRECLVRVQRADGWPSAACGQRAVARLRSRHQRLGARMWMSTPGTQVVPLSRQLGQRPLENPHQKEMDGCLFIVDGLQTPPKPYRRHGPACVPGGRDWSLTLLVQS